MVKTYPQSEFSPPPDSTRFVLVRHGQSMPAVPDEPFELVDGHGNPHLSPRGLAQAQRVSDRLATETFDALYCSTLTRTRQTATPLAERLGLSVQVEPEIREVFLGVGEGGRLRIMAEEQDPMYLAMRANREWGEVPGAETNLELTERVVRALERMHSSHPGQTVGVFCHAGVIGAAVGHALQVNPFRMSGARNGSITELVRTPEDWILRSFNDASHIGSLFADDDIRLER